MLHAHTPMSSVHMYCRCLFLPASLVIHHSNMLSEEQYWSPICLTPSIHVTASLSLHQQSKTKKQIVKLLELPWPSWHRFGSWSSRLMASASQTIHIQYLVFLDQKHDVDIKCSKEKAHKQTRRMTLPFLLLFHYDTILMNLKMENIQFSWMWRRMMHLSLTTSLDLPKAQWKRITNRLPTLHENLRNLSVWADKRSTYISLPFQPKVPNLFGANLVGKWVPDTDKNWGWMKSEESKISHKKFNPRITFPATANMHNL